MEWRNIGRGKEKYLPMFDNASSIIVFDTETTGLGTTAKIIEFAAVRYQITPSGLHETHRIDLFINPEIKLEEKIIELTGITDEILEKAETEQKEAKNVYGFLDTADLWAAYNCQFDLRMLDQMSERTGIRYIKRPCIDILAMARDHVSKEDSKSHKLSAICGLLFPEDRFEYHSALEDVRACAKLMAKFVGLYRTYEEPAEKRQCHVEYASYFVNPRQKSQVRIKLKLPEGGYGDIFWDVVGKTWSCKSDKKAKELFANIDMKNIEEQVLNRYGWRYHASDMETLAANWGREKRETLKKQASA